MVIRHKHWHEHGGDGDGAMLVGIAVFLFVGLIAAYVEVLLPLTDRLFWVCLIGYPVFAYLCSSSIAEAVRRTVWAGCWFMISAIVAGIPLALLAGFIAGPKQEANVITVGLFIAGIIGMGCYTLWTFGARKT